MGPLSGTLEAWLLWQWTTHRAVLKVGSLSHYHYPVCTSRTAPSALRSICSYRALTSDSLSLSLSLESESLSGSGLAKQVHLEHFCPFDLVTRKYWETVFGPHVPMCVSFFFSLTRMSWALFTLVQDELSDELPWIFWLPLGRTRAFFSFSRPPPPLSARCLWNNLDLLWKFWRTKEEANTTVPS